MRARFCPGFVDAPNVEDYDGAGMEDAMKKYSLALLALVALSMVGGCTTFPGSESMGPSTDEQLARDVQMRLANDPLAADFTFGITAVGSTVTVDGAVPSENLRVRVIGIARGTPGVTEVVDKLYRR